MRKPFITPSSETGSSYQAPIAPESQAAKSDWIGGAQAAFLVVPRRRSDQHDGLEEAEMRPTFCKAAC